jgi:hypothetical protein
VYDGVGQLIGHIVIGTINSTNKTIYYQDLIADAGSLVDSETQRTLLRLGVDIGGATPNLTIYMNRLANDIPTGTNTMSLTICRPGENMVAVKMGSAGYHYWDRFGGSVDLSTYYNRDEVDAITTSLWSELYSKAPIATTLAGYGITDAYTQTVTDEHINTATANSATLPTNATIDQLIVGSDGAKAVKTLAGGALGNVLRINGTGKPYWASMGYTTITDSDEIVTDGTLGIANGDLQYNLQLKNVNVSKLIQTEGDTLIFNGGTSAT